jgi:hypothetical protein
MFTVQPHAVSLNTVGTRVQRILRELGLPGGCAAVSSPACRPLVRSIEWARYRKIARTSPALLVRGTVEKADGAINLRADRLATLTVAARTAPATSADPHGYRLAPRRTRQRTAPTSQT